MPFFPDHLWTSLGYHLRAQNSKPDQECTGCGAGIRHCLRTTFCDDAVAKYSDKASRTSSTGPR